MHSVSVVREKSTIELCFTVSPSCQVAMKHPAAVTACNLDLENLIVDVNRSIATLAITTLLKVNDVSHY